MKLGAATKNLSKLLDFRSIKLLDHFGMFNPSPVTLQQLVDFGKVGTEADSFGFVTQEVPIRLANIMKEINLLPSSLLQMPSVVQLQVRTS